MSVAERPSVRPIEADATLQYRTALEPFDFTRRMMSVLVQDTAGHSILLTKGAPEEIVLRGAALFQTGWFAESLMTQTLIIHVIRTNKIPFLQSRASRPLSITTLAIMAMGMLWLRRQRI